jgi:hypothetical protein
MHNWHGNLSPFGKWHTAGGTLSPAVLFALGEPGAWYDPSDLTTMFQDRAGTTPVTAAGQSVGYRMDKSGRGNHAVANSDAARGIYGIEPLGGRRNLLTFTEQFDNAAWNKTSAGTGSLPVVTANAAVAPDGTTTADQVVFNSGVGTASTNWSTLTQNATVSAVNHTGSVYVRTVSGTATLVFRNAGAATFEAISVTDQWQRFDRIELGLAGTGNRFELGVRQGLAGIGVINSTAIVLIWGAQLEVGSTATNYQRVTTQYDVTEAGVPSLHYVQYDGADDGYVTPTITPNTDKVQVFAGVRKLSDAALGMVLEASASSINNGTIAVFAPNPSLAGYQFRSRGTTPSDSFTLSSDFAAPNTNVLTGLGDISGDRAILRINGSQVAQSIADQGTGNYLAHPLYIGRRGGTELPFNGRDYGLIVRFGPNLDANTISNVEKYLAQKTGVTL